MERPEHRHAALVVEDDPTIRELLSDLLTAADCDIVVAADMAEVASLLSSDQRPCIVFFDATLSRGEADSLMQHVACRSWDEAVPVVASRTRAAGEGVRLLGALSCVEKPFALGPIVAVVGRQWARAVRGRGKS